MMSIEEGKKAPAFTLPDENGDKVKLTDLTGQWIVLYFYPKDNSQYRERGFQIGSFHARN